MRLDLLAMLVTSLLWPFVSGAKTGPCPSGTVSLSVTTLDDVETLVDALNCTGFGEFNVTWYTSLQIGDRIDVSNNKTITVTGLGFPTIRGALDDDDGAGGNVTSGSSAGIFSVSRGSILRLNYLVLEGGTAYRGGAVSAYSSSLLSVSGCMFTNNHASNKGGAVYAQFSSVSLHGNTEFASNYAEDGGGAIYASSSEIDIGGNAIFTDNSAGISGGAVYVRYFSNVTLHGNVEFASNHADYSGGAVYANRSSVTLHGKTECTSNYAGALGGQSEVPALFPGAIYAFLSETGIGGNAIFTNNSAGSSGGAITVAYGNLTIAGSKELHEDVAGNGGGLYPEAGGDYTFDRSVAFVDNYAPTFGGAIIIGWSDLVQVSDATFKSNAAAVGGAIFVVAVEDKQTRFSACVFEGNVAEDGGAIYLHTGPGVDIFTASVFRNNFATTSGGAIFHTGAMKMFDSSFVANEAGVEGAAVMSIGLLEELSNVTFAENTFFCSAGEYGYIAKTETDFCSACFDEVCSRCSTFGEGVSKREEVRIDGIPVCAQPPPGSAAPSSGTTVANLTIEKGYFRISNTSHDVRKCYRENACQGGNDTGKYCAPGYTGPYCAVCAQGYAPGVSYSCHQCSGGIMGSAVGLAVAVGLVVLLLAAILIPQLGSVVHDGADEDIRTAQSVWKQKWWYCQAFLVKPLPFTAIKIVVTVWQIISQFDAIAGDVYPELYQNFVSKLNLINLDVDFLLLYSCLVTNDFYDHLLFATTTPFLVLAILAGSYFIAKKRNSCSESAMREVRHKHQAAALYVAFLVYSPVSYRIFQIFGCDELDDKTTYLRADYSLSCLTPRHSWYTVYALIMVGVYPIGIASATAALLFWHRRDLVKPDRETAEHLKPLNGVVAAYLPSRYYYEVVECCRRIFLTSIAAFVLPNSTAQISIALLFAVVFVFISEALSPFQKSADMGLYRWGNGIIVASMYVAFLVKIDLREDTTYALLTFSGVIIAANVFMVVTVLVQTVVLVKEWRKHRNPVKPVDVPLRRTASVSVRYVESLHEGGASWEKDWDIESKTQEI